MSASQKKKIRQAAEEAARIEELSKQSKEKKKTKTKIIIGSVIGVIVVAIVVLFSINLFYNKTTAVDINGTKYSVADFNYYYVDRYNSYYNSVYNMVGEDNVDSYMPANSISLRNQIFDEETGQTWADYLQEYALKRMESVTSLVEKAKAENVTLTDDDKETLSSKLMTVDYSATSNGFKNTAKYLEYLYGKGMTVEKYAEIVENEMLATRYATTVSESFEYSEELIKSTYEENKDDLDYIRYYCMFIPADENLDSHSDAMKAAMQDAEGVAAQIYDESTFSSASVNYILENPDSFQDRMAYTNDSVQGQNIPESCREWLLDSARQQYDVEVFETSAEDGSLSDGYNIIMFVEHDSNDYNSIDGKFILVPYGTVSEDDYETDEEYDAAYEEEKTSAEAMAQNIIEDWNSSSYEEFEDLIAFYMYDISDYADLDKAGKGDFATTVRDWMFDETRQPGDAEIVERSGVGYYVAIYEGQNDLYADVLADKLLRSEDYAEWEESSTDGYTATTTWNMRLARKMSSLGG